MEKSCDILLLNETWLKGHPSNSMIPDGYSSCHVNREKRRGGGVMLIHRSSLHITEVKPVTHQSFGYIEVLLNANNILYRIVACYRLPNTNSRCGVSTNIFFDEFEFFLLERSVNTENLLIMGDFNFHMNDVHDNNCKALNSITTCSNMSENLHTLAVISWISS